jgi:hypothetical protein
MVMMGIAPTKEKKEMKMKISVMKSQVGILKSCLFWYCFLRTKIKKVRKKRRATEAAPFMSGSLTV